MPLLSCELAPIEQLVRLDAMTRATMLTATSVSYVSLNDDHLFDLHHLSGHHRHITSLT